MTTETKCPICGGMGTVIVQWVPDDNGLMEGEAPCPVCEIIKENQALKVGQEKRCEGLRLASENHLKLLDHLHIARSEVESLKFERDQLKNRVEEMNRELRMAYRYVEHSEDCAFKSEDLTDDRCTCGLSKLLGGGE